MKAMITPRVSLRTRKRLNEICHQRNISTNIAVTSIIEEYIADGMKELFNGPSWCDCITCGGTGGEEDNPCIPCRGIGKTRVQP